MLLEILVMQEAIVSMQLLSASEKTKSWKGGLCHSFKQQTKWRRGKGGRKGPSHLSLLAESIHHSVLIYHDLKFCCRKAGKLLQPLKLSAVLKRDLTESAFVPAYYNCLGTKRTLTCKNTQLKTGAVVSEAVLKDFKEAVCKVVSNNSKELLTKYARYQIMFSLKKIKTQDIEL